MGGRVVVSLFLVWGYWVGLYPLVFLIADGPNNDQTKKGTSRNQDQEPGSRPQTRTQTQTQIRLDKSF